MEVKGEVQHPGVYQLERHANVEKAIKEGRIQMNVEIEAFTTDIRMIVIGNVFEWCLRNGEADFEGNMARSLGKYLDSTLD